jgi:hypothetical protein
MSDAAQLVSRWAEAWNACDVEGIVGLAHPEFRMHRMKGDVIDRDGLMEDDELIGATDDGGMAVEVREGKVVFAAPQLTSADALAKAGLTEDGRVFEWGGQGA